MLGSGGICNTRCEIRTWINVIAVGMERNAKARGILKIDRI